MTGQETAALVDCVQTWRYRVDSRQHGFFLAKKQREVFNATQDNGEGEFEDKKNGDGVSPRRPTTDRTYEAILGHNWSIGSLSEYEGGFFNGIPLEDQYICFADPSTYPDYPGWMLRNLLVLVHRRWKLDRVQILCYRDVQANRDDARSLIFNLELGQKLATTSPTPRSPLDSFDMPKTTGWERNTAGKVTSRVANLGEYMDPQRLVSSNFN